VAAARTRAGTQEHRLRRAAARLQRQARQAAAARQALTLRAVTLAQARDLRADCRRGGWLSSVGGRGLSG
jgi:hypothetical protein